MEVHINSGIQSTVQLSHYLPYNPMVAQVNRKKNLHLNAHSHARTPNASCFCVVSTLVLFAVERKHIIKSHQS
jgi:hypothetical protein